MSKNKKQKTYNIKITFLGEAGVGKTNLINIYLDKNFNPNEMTTFDPNQSFKTLKIGNTKLNINLWDSIGQEKYRSITKSFIKGSNIIIFVYDVTRRVTFLELNFWISAVNEELNTDEVIFGVVGNKIDLYEENYEVDKKEGERYATKINALFCEASAKEDPKGFQNYIKQLLEKLLSTQNIIDNLEEVKDSSFYLKKPSKEKNQDNKTCCE